LPALSDQEKTVREAGYYSFARRVVGGAGVEVGAEEGAGAVVVVVVVDDVDAGEDWAVFMRTFPAAALILFI